MSRRVEMKLKSIRMFLRKDIFSGKYIVRNLLVATIILSLVATVAGVASVVGTDGGDTKEADQSTSAYTIEYVAGVELDANSISIMRANMEADSEPNVQPNATEMVAGATNEFDSKFVSIEDHVNVREAATTESAIVGKLNAGTVGEILSSDGEWLNIKSGQVTGYVKAEFVLTGDAAAEYAKDYQIWTGTLTESGVYIRKEASTDAGIIDTAYIGAVYPVDYETTSTLDGWVCIIVDDSIKGYIYADYITVDNGYPSAVSLAKEQETTKDSDNTKDNSASGSVTENKNDNNNNNSKPASEPAVEQNNTSAGNQVTVTPTTRGAIYLSEEDINLMATVLTLECGGEPYEGQLAVANLIINRMQSGRWGSTVSDVVYAPNQFSVVTSSKMDYYLQNGAQASCVQAVREACAGNNNIGSYLSFRPTYNAKTSTYSSYTIIGNHVFF